MLIIIISAILLAIGIFLSRDWETENAGVVVGSIGGVILMFMLIALPICRLTERGNIQMYHAIKATIEQARTAEISELERASLTTKIIEVNSWLACSQYWNEGSMFDIYYPDEVMELEPLK